MLKDEKFAIVVGDYNFDNQVEYQKNILDNGFVDAVTDKFEGTDPAEEFSFTMPSNGQFSKWRPDKICTPKKDQDAKFILDMVDAQRVGWFAIQPYAKDS